MTVTHAVEAIGGAVKSVSPTRAEIELNNTLSRQAVVEAITRAGYNVEDHVS